MADDEQEHTVITDHDRYGTYAAGPGSDKDQQKLDELREAFQKDPSDEKARKAYKKQQEKVQQARSEWRGGEEKQGARIGPNTPPEVLEALQEAAAAVEGDGVASAEPPSASGEVSNP